MLKDETSPETPLAKTNSDPPPPPDGWRSPRAENGDELAAATDPPPSSNTHISWASGGSVRVYSVKGPSARILLIGAFVVFDVLAVLFFFFAISIGTVLALGVGAAAVLGYAGRHLRTQAASGKPRELSDHQP